MKKFITFAAIIAISAMVFVGPADAKCRSVVVWGYGIGLCLPH